MKKFILICAVFSITLIASEAYSFSKIEKKLELKNNYSHLITFNEKIIRYRIADKEAFEVEVLPNILNTRHEMLVRPLKKTNTNMFVWTESCLYNFNIESKRKKGFASLFSFNSNNSKRESAVLDGYELDLPPASPQNVNIMDIEIDLPPGVN